MAENKSGGAPLSSLACAFTVPPATPPSAFEDPLVCEVIGSLRREIAALEERLKTKEAE